MSRRSYGRYSFEAANEDKVLFPEAGITKGDLIDYYEKIADTMLPHIRARPVTMLRMPDGIVGKAFYQKDVPAHFPAWLDTITVEKQDGTVRHVIASNAASLAYLASQCCITPHIWLSRYDRPYHPDRLILDLDPPDDDFVRVRKAAQQARALFEKLELPVFVMTTGSRGLHLVVPLDRSQDFDAVREFASGFAEQLAERHPEELTTNPRKDQRGDRIYLDVARNAYAQTAVAPYAVRPRPGAPVATPVSWKEVGSSSLTPDRYSIGSIFRRLGQKQDPWKGMQKFAVGLKGAQEKLE